jgi:hypothetical protein
VSWLASSSLASSLRIRPCGGILHRTSWRLASAPRERNPGETSMSSGKRQVLTSSRGVPHEGLHPRRAFRPRGGTDTPYPRFHYTGNSPWGLARMSLASKGQGPNKPRAHAVARGGTCLPPEHVCHLDRRDQTTCSSEFLDRGTALDSDCCMRLKR